MMDESLLDRWRQRLLPWLPRAYREGVMPWVFLLAVLVMGLMVVFAFINSALYGSYVPLSFAATLGLLLVAMGRGLALGVAIEIAMAMGMGMLLLAAWWSGGVFSPRLAWLLLLPVTPFFFLGVRVGLRWLAIVAVVQSLIALTTWQGWLGRSLQLGVAHAGASLATYVAVTLLMMVIPFIYHSLNQRALRQERAYQATLERQREALEQTQALRDRFIASVSHELRTPMNAILGLNELLLSRIHDKPEALKVLNHTRHSADHLMTVINDVLDYSQLQSGSLVLHPSTFELQPCVRNAFDVLEPRARAQQLEYRCLCDPGVPTWVSTDRHRLVQVLVNLLGNALKFTPRGQVILRVSPCPQGVRFEVQDSGIGIPQHQQAGIFRRYAQADQSIQQRYGGNGLGLAISRRLVELLGGEIGFESREGFGSRFWFQLPLRPAQPLPSETSSVQQAIQTAQRRWRFLVVDDHPVNRLLVHRVLKVSWPQADIREAVDGLEALQALQEGAMDAVFMDMRMPNLDGIEATRRIRQELPVPQSKVVVFGLTANVNPDDLVRFRAAGLDGLMLKPFDWRLLCAETERLLLERQG